MAKRAAQGVVDDGVAARIESDVQAALRRKPAQEGKLAGALRVLAPSSQRLRTLQAAIVETLVKRGTFARPLYAASVRGLCEQGEKRAVTYVKRALMTDDAGGLSTLSGSCFVQDPSLSDALARVAASRHPHLAFASEVARVARREANGGHVAAVAPKIKESHRIELCMELFVPLLWGPRLPVAIAPALAVLRDAERHLGRWLVFGEVAARAGDEKPLREARQRAAEGPSSARSAWAMVAWALGGEDADAPSIRPTVELVARLSDRPSADRDMTFLFRLAAARVAAARPMLESLAKGQSLVDETAIRAALYLARDHARADMLRALRDTAGSARRDALRGLAVAALFDAGERDGAAEIAGTLCGSRQVATAAWSALVLAAHAGRSTDVIVTEPAFRRIQLGWVE